MNKNKHGRVGVKKPPKPITWDQRKEAYEEGFDRGMFQGVKAAQRQCLGVVNGSRTIREARKRIQELVDAPNK